MTQIKWAMIPVSEDFKVWIRDQSVGRESYQATLERLLNKRTTKKRKKDDLEPREEE